MTSNNTESQTNQDDTSASALTRALDHLVVVPGVALAFVLVVSIIGVSVFYGYGSAVRAENEVALEELSYSIARSDVRSASVPVNGPRGTDEYRARHKRALEAYLSEFDFPDTCTASGFRRDKAEPGTLTCITTGGYTLTRSATDTHLEVFKQDGTRMAKLDLSVLYTYDPLYVDMNAIVEGIQLGDQKSRLAESARKLKDFTTKLSSPAYPEPLTPAQSDR